MSTCPRKRRFNTDSDDEIDDEPLTKCQKVLDESTLGCVAKNLYATINNDNMHDVTFQIGSGDQIKQFRATRALFAAQSEIFKSMLYGAMKESNISNTVIITDISPMAFNAIRDICYFCNPSIEYQHVVDILYAGNMYTTSIYYINTDIDNIFMKIY